MRYPGEVKFRETGGRKGLGEEEMNVMFIEFQFER